MQKFNAKKSKEMPAISTASLPDIIFILLFFFMVVTVIRPQKLVKTSLPEASEIVKLENQSWIHHIYVGIPKDGKYGSAPRIQLNDYIAETSDIKQFILDERENTPDREHGLLTTSIKADREVKMGIITDVKQELRKINQLKINYSSTPRGSDWN